MKTVRPIEGYRFESCPRRPMTLQDHIEQVEKYGLNRDIFPVRYDDHSIQILKNDAHKTNEDRLLFHFVLYCENCKQESSISGRFPADDNSQIEHVSNAKIASFHEFDECDV